MPADHTQLEYTPLALRSTRDRASAVVRATRHSHDSPFSATVEQIAKRLSDDQLQGHEPAHHAGPDNASGPGQQPPPQPAYRPTGSARRRLVPPFAWKLAVVTATLAGFVLFVALSHDRGRAVIPPIPVAPSVKTTTLAPFADGTMHVSPCGTMFAPNCL
jgi:hypothetical protein